MTCLAVYHFSVAVTAIYNVPSRPALYEKDTVRGVVFQYTKRQRQGVTALALSFWDLL